MIFNQYIFKVNKELEDKLNQELLRYAVVNQGNRTLTLVYDRTRRKESKVLYSADILRETMETFFNNYEDMATMKHYQYAGVCARANDYCESFLKPKDDDCKNELERVFADVVCIFKTIPGRLLTKQADMTIISVKADSIEDEEIFSFTLYKNLLTLRFNDKFKKVKAVFE